MVRLGLVTCQRESDLVRLGASEARAPRPVVPTGENEKEA